MSEQFELIYRCSRCGWVKPKNSRCQHCPKCGGTLKPVVVKKKVYDDAYRDKHWKKCRHGEDLRTCGTWVWENGQYVYKVGYYSKKVNGEYVIFCKLDGKPCDCEWTGDRD